MTMVSRRLSAGCLAVALAAGLMPALAEARKLDIRGISPGMTADEIVEKAQITCRINRSDNVSCVDPQDGSEFKVLMSGGKPSRAISVKHTFCSGSTPSSVLTRLLGDYGVARSASRPSPNGATFDITPTVVGILNTSGDPCAGGRKTFQFMISDTGSQMQR